MKKKNQLIKFASLCIAMVAVLTMAFAVKAKTEAKANPITEWFERVSVKKCAITLKQDEFEWTGKQIKPEININYKGTKLVKNVDYILNYKNNVEAGTARIEIEGKGNYKGSTYINFKINGVDFKKECIVSVNNGIVEVYYKGQLLRNETDYWYTVMTQDLLQKSVPTGDGYLNTYKSTTYYTINGKGKFGGSIVKTTTKTDTKFEYITWSNED